MSFMQKKHLRNILGFLRIFAGMLYDCPWKNLVHVRACYKVYSLQTATIKRPQAQRPHTKTKVSYQKPLGICQAFLN